MYKKPELNLQISLEDFKSHYWLKEELIAFSKVLKLSTSGSKENITDRIYEYLKNGNKKKEVNKTIKSTHNKNYVTSISLDLKIPENYKNDETNRIFFKSVIGSHFKFNVQFINWMKSNHGKTYKEAVDEWIRIYNEIKNEKIYEISKQFEYNQYIRDFFKDNKGKSLDDAIKCWNYKKQFSGKHNYDRSDLKALD